MASRPRTPQHFPRMKVRGARRRTLAPWQRLAGTFDALAAAFDAMTRTSARFTQAINTIGSTKEAA